MSSLKWKKNAIGTGENIVKLKKKEGERRNIKLRSENLMRNTKAEK